MTTLTLASLARSSARTPQSPQFRRRWLHRSIARRAIMMPATSPFMTEGTIARWNKKEGEAFAAGDVLLQIESDIAVIDVEAESAGILSKILMPEGTTNVPVEQVIALVSRNENELAIPTPSPFNIFHSSPSQLHSPIHMANWTPPLLSPARRHLAIDSNDNVNLRGLTSRRARENGLTIVPPSPSLRSAIPTNSATSSAKHTLSPRTGRLSDVVENLAGLPTERESPVDGAAVRRMFVANFIARTPLSPSVNIITPTQVRMDSKGGDWFEAVLY